MSATLKVKLILIAFCMFAVAASQFYTKGVDDGIATVDAEAFESYTHFAKQMKAETHKASHEARKPHTDTVWAAVDRKGE